MRNPVAVTVFSVTTSAPTVTATDRQETTIREKIDLRASFHRENYVNLQPICPDSRSKRPV